MIPASEAAINRAREDLFRRYLSLPAGQREQEFPGTARAAKRVGVSPRTIQLWIEDGKVPAIFIGRKYKVHFESLLAHVQSRMHEQ